MRAVSPTISAPVARTSPLARPLSITVPVKELFPSNSDPSVMIAVGWSEEAALLRFQRMMVGRGKHCARSACGQNRGLFGMKAVPLCRGQNAHAGLTCQIGRPPAGGREAPRVSATLRRIDGCQKIAAVLGQHPAVTP